MKKETMLHHLRNPYGIDELEMREAKLQAADELERLYAFVFTVKNMLEIMQTSEKDFHTGNVFKAIPECKECYITPCACEVHG